MKDDSAKGPTNNFHEWIAGLDGNALSVWREAMAQLRQLHGDVWNGVRFFLTVNGIIVAAIFALYRIEGGTVTGVIISVLAGLGLFLTAVADRILAKHRQYYLEMLLRKTLLEKELGFYESNIAGVDLSFPWKVDAKDLDEIRDSEKWKTDQSWRPGTISRLLKVTYRVFIAFYVVALAMALVILLL
jgi:hypothetical protein